jgi:plastocyanin
VLAIALAGAAVAGCGGTQPAPRTSGSTGGSTAATSLRIAGYAFHPKTLTVKAGTKVTVTNNDSTAHTATAKSGAFDSGTLKPGQAMRFTLNKPGVYQYYCQFHAFMTGTIKVVK